MAGRVPLEVGARGTVGSLLKREIEYFTRLELERVESCMNSERDSEDMAPGIRNSWPGFRFLMVSWKKKKRRNSGIRTGICSKAEVSDSQGLSEIPGFTYRNLRVDLKKLQV